MTAPAPTELLKLADETKAIFDRIEVSGDWRLSIEERASIASASEMLHRQAASVERAEVAGEARDALLAFRHGDTKHLTQEHARVLFDALASPPRSERVRGCEVLTKEALRLLHNSTCFGKEVCTSLPCPCAESLATLGAAQAQTGCGDPVAYRWRWQGEVSHNPWRLVESANALSSYTTEVEPLYASPSVAQAPLKLADKIHDACPHNMGYGDYEIGPIGCRLVGQELECVCEHVHMHAIRADRSEATLSPAMLDEIAAIWCLVHDEHVSAEAIGIRIRNTWLALEASSVPSAHRGGEA